MLCIASALGLKAQEGTYYLFNESSGLFLSRGASWGTQAVAANYGIDFEISLANGQSVMKNVDHSLVVNRNKYLGDNLFTDNDNAKGYTFTLQDDGSYLIDKGSGYLTVTGVREAIAENSEISDASKWKLLTKEQYLQTLAQHSNEKIKEIALNAGISDVSTIADLKEKLADHNVYAEVNKTSSIGNADIGEASAAWTIWADTSRGRGETQSSSGTFQTWNGSTDINQTIGNLPSGIYKVTVQAFYRLGGADNAIRTADKGNVTANLYANGSSAQLVSWYDIHNGSNPNTQPESYNVFAANENACLVEVYTYVGEDGTLTLGIDNRGYVDADWMVCDNFKLYYYTDKVEDDAIAEIEATIPENIPNTVKQQLNALLEKLKSSRAIVDYNTLNAAISETKPLIAPYSHYQEIKTNVLDLTKQQVYTGEATPDVAAADNAVEAATTVEGINEAITLLRKAAATFLGAVSVKEGQFFTITNVFLENADFSAGNIEGWETNYVAGQQAQNIGYQGNKYTNGDVTIEKFIEAWKPANNGTLGDGYLRQIVANLPEGKYTLEADAIAVNQDKADATTTGALLYIEADGVTYSEEMSTGNNKPEHFEVEFLSTGGVDVAFGLQTKETTANWICADNFEVKFYGVDLSAYAPQLEAAVAEAQKVAEEATTKAAYAAVLKAIEDYNKEWTSSQEYTTAIAAIQSATAAANALVAPKAEFIAQKSQVLALTEVEGYTEKNNATATFENALEEAEAAMEEATEIAAIDAQIEAVKTATKTFLAGVRSDGVHPFDITFFIVNASFDNNDATGWTANPAPGFQSYTNCEYFEKDFDIHQTLTNMPAGNYELKVQAFQRPGAFSAVYNAYKAGNDAVSSVIYINDGETKIKNLVAEGATTSDKQWHEGNDSHIEGGSDYYANSMRGAAAAFAAGYYENTVLTHVEGELTFGFKSTKAHVGSDWTIFDNFRLYFYGNSIAVAMDEAETFNAPLSDIEGANVTLKRTTVAGLNTVALPFDMDEAQVKDVFGDDAVVYTYSDEGESENQVTVNFTTAETKIEANVPVLVKASKATDEIKVDNVTVKAGEAKVEGNYFDFVANYGGNITLAEGVYFVSSNALYKSTGKSTLKGFRAMLTPRNVEENVEVKLFVDDLETSIDAIDGSVEAENGAIYNIAGQRVQKAVKGLYIVNGKKILVK